VDCTRRPVSVGLCGGHYAQHKVGKPLSTLERRTDVAGFSETKKCDYCRKTKNWKLFVIGADSKKSECRECYRKRILPPKQETEKKLDVKRFLEEFTTQGM
jgi:hypothetical protein